jgi:peptide/nickel transport system substrate-binding protein
VKRSTITKGRLTRRALLVQGSAIALVAACAPAVITSPSPAASGGASGASAGSAPAAASGAPKTGGTFIYANNVDVAPLIPGSTATVDHQRVLSLMYEGLVTQDLHDLKDAALPEKPWLAESWDISSDGLQYTFKLRQNVKFHDGTPFDADAVKVNFERATLASSPYYDKTVAGLSAKIYNYVAKGEVVDKYGWRLTLKSPVGEFIRLLADRVILMVSPAALAKYGAAGIVDHPVGTGPFTFVQRVAGQRIELAKNKDYWAGAPYLDKVIMTVVPDAQARFAALKSGEVDFVTAMDPDQAAIYKADPNVNLVFNPSPMTWVWMLNCKQGPTTNKQVRQALNYAWNRDALVKDLLLDLATPAIAPAAPGNAASPPSHAQYTYDPEKAKKMLADAGYPNGFAMTLVYGDKGLNDQVNTLIQSDFRKVGVDVKLEKMEYAAFLSMFSKGLPDQYGGGQTFWATSAHLGQWLETVFSSKFQPPHGNNRDWYSSAEVDRLLDEARPISDPKKSADAYRKVLDVVMEDAPWVWFYHDKNPMAVRKRVHGLDITSSQFFDLKPVWVDA